MNENSPIMNEENRKPLSNKTPIIFIFILIISAQCTSAEAYRLPGYSISESDRILPSEIVLENYRSELSGLDDSARLAEHKQNPKIRLRASSRGQVKRFNELTVAIAFWKRVLDLKKTLISLNGVSYGPAQLEEADAIAKIVIETLYDLSQKYEVAGSALIQNFLINRGIKKKGFCYHYVDDLRKELSKVAWKYFDLRWGTAWDGDFRENNSLVITAIGRPFDEGIAIDAWRTAGKPFWTPVKGDRFPWVEAFNVEIE